MSLTRRRARLAAAPLLLALAVSACGPHTDSTIAMSVCAVAAAPCTTATPCDTVSRSSSVSTIRRSCTSCRTRSASPAAWWLVIPGSSIASSSPPMRATSPRSGTRSVMTQLPQIVTTFDGLVTTLDQQRPLFRSADAIPTKSIPATTLPWMLAGLGVVLVLVGGTMWFSPQAGATTAVVLGALMIALPLALSLPQKASDADKLNSNLKPVYTAAMVTQAKDALATVSAMGTQMQTQMLPALATQLHLTPAQLQQMMATSFPATAAAIGNLPTALPRFQTLVADFDSNLGNYDTLKPVSFVPIIWTTMGLGLLTLIGGSVALLWPRHKLYFVL